MKPTPAHFTHQYLLAPTNPISVNLIGAGGTGSTLLTALARMNHALVSLGHAGMKVCLWDPDKVTESNLGRQLFAQAELGQHKAQMLILRTNRFFGTDWKAIATRYPGHSSDDNAANITISCVDTASARHVIATTLKRMGEVKKQHRDRPLYWLDFGNSQKGGQVFLATIGQHGQPTSEKFTPVDSLPFVTDEHADLLQDEDSDTPSCSLAEALQKQDLFINSTLANLGCSLLWNLFRQGYTPHRGFFLNLAELRTMPVPV